MRRTKEEAEITKQKLLTAGLDVFSRKGYKATRVEDIARRANVTTGAIYHHFDGKSDLFITLVEKSEARANQIAQQIIGEGGTPATILRRLLVRLFEFIEDDSEYRAVYKLFFNKTDFLPELPVIAERVLEGRRQLAHFFSNLIREGIIERECEPTVVPDDTALALVGFLHGMVLFWVQDSEYFSIKERAEHLVDTFLSGILLEGE